MPAVRTHRISALTGDEFVVPGPRVVDATRKLAQALHPGRRSNENAGVLVERQGQRLDGARRCGSSGDIEIGALLTTINESAQRVAMHAVRVERAAGAGRGARAAAVEVPIPSPCPNEVYERAMAAAVARAVGEGFTHVAFGDLFLEDIRRYREERLAGSGLTPMFPLFGTDADTPALAREMVAGGLRARITCLNPKVLDRRFAGREFDAALLDELPPSIDPCGERGEFHTLRLRRPDVRAADCRSKPAMVVERDGFVFTDSPNVAIPMTR